MIINFDEFIYENSINFYKEKLNIEIDIEIDISGHILTSLNRNNNEIDRFGEKIITKNDIIILIKKSLTEYLFKKIFTNHNNSWDKNNKLIKNFCIKDDDNLNIIIDIEKIALSKNRYKFKIVAITAYRKKDFKYKPNDDIYNFKN